MQSHILRSKIERCLEVKFKFTDLDQKYVGRVLSLTHQIAESDSTLSAFKPKIKIWHTDDLMMLEKMEQDHDSRHISLTIQDTKLLKCEFKSLITTFVDVGTYDTPPETSSEKKPSDREIDIGFKFAYPACLINERLKSIEGTMKMAFEPNEIISLNQLLELQFSILRMHQHPENFGIRCEDTEVKFNKNFLCKISDVFAAMIENPCTSESQQGFVIIENVRAELINQFKEVVCKGNVTIEDLNVDLLMFADRYNIQPLVNLTKSQIKKTISKENLFDVIKASDALNDDQLLKAAVDFVSENKGSFQNDPELMEMMKSNSQCFAKMWGMLMFKNN